MGGVSGEGIMGTDSQSNTQDGHESEIVETKTLGGVIAAASGYENPQSNSASRRRRLDLASKIKSPILHFARSLVKFARFVGPGFLIAVAYIDPGNYATDVAAGARFRYALLFIVLLSNLFAIFLQSLCIKLGSVTGLNLAENCREHLPRWLVYILYVLSEAAIVATDIAEVWPIYSTVLPLSEP
jgi:metal iron transporter